MFWLSAIIPKYVTRRRNDELLICEILQYVATGYLTAKLKCRPPGAYGASVGGLNWAH